MSVNKSLRVLVVGGAGYIGSHVTKALKKVGHRPVIFDNLSSGLRKNFLPGVPFLHGDILIPGQLKEAFEYKIDAVIHLAALKAAGESMVIPGKYAVHNISGTTNLINAVIEANVDKLVFSSTAAVYGTPKYLPLDELHPKHPINFYGYTKLAIENQLRWFDQVKGLKSACLRYFNAAGYDVEGQLNGLEQNPANLLPVVMETITGMRDHLEIFGDDYETNDGSCIRDYIHVTDLAAAHVQALNYLEREHQSLTVNLGTSKGLSVFEIVETAKKLSGVDFQVVIAPRRTGDPPELYAKTEQAESILGWKAKYSDINTLIETMLLAYRSQTNQ